MLEAVEEEPVVDVHERLVPESERVHERLDFFAWYLAYVAGEIDGYGIQPEALAALRDGQTAPDERWSTMASFWPYVRTTSAGRVVLRVAWELCGVEDVDERTWKEVSASLWRACKPGFYRENLIRRANIRATLIDGPVEPEMRSCCVPMANCDPVLAVGCREEVEAWSRELDGSGTTLDELDDLVGRWVQREVEREAVALKLGTLPTWTSASASIEEIEWALGRVLIRDEGTAQCEPALHGYLCHRMLEHVAAADRPVLVPIGEPASVERLGTLVRAHPEVRFVGLLNEVGCGSLGAYAMLSLSRLAPNVSLAIGDLWRVAPYVARDTLRAWLQSVPLHKLFALGGEATLVEAACAQALIVREQIAALLAEMVTQGELDEGDALRAMHRLLSGNAVDYFGLRTYPDLAIAPDFP
jgi:hypothetical protein